MMFTLETFNTSNHLVQPVNTSWLRKAGVVLDMLRLDALDPHISGNKWYKLKYNLLAAQKAGKSTILSFGGAWSNHIHALAAAGNRFGLATVGVIRGEQQTAMLLDAAHWGMRLHFLSRSDYRQKNDPAFQAALLSTLGLTTQNVHIVPEGGSNRLGVQGCRDILPLASAALADYDEIWLACGTGATLAGLALAAAEQRPHTAIKGVAVLKGGAFLCHDIHRYTHQSLDNWSILTDYHHGGYAQTSPALLEFINAFEGETAIPLEPVYTGKVMYALWHSLMANPKSMGRILMIHTGGLQGNRGMR